MHWHYEFNIEMSQGKNIKLGLYKGNDPNVVAQKFCSEYNLNHKFEEILCSEINLKAYVLNNIITEECSYADISQSKNENLGDDDELRPKGIMKSPPDKLAKKTTCFQSMNVDQISSTNSEIPVDNCSPVHILPDSQNIKKLTNLNHISKSEIKSHREKQHENEIIKCIEREMLVKKAQILKEEREISECKFLPKINKVDTLLRTIELKAQERLKTDSIFTGKRLNSKQTKKE